MTVLKNGIHTFCLKIVRNYAIDLILFILLFTFITFLGVHPCDKVDKKCCSHNWSDRLGHDIRSVLKIMKFANRQGKSWFDIKSVIGNDTKKIRYQLNDHRSNIQPDINSMIPWCQLNGIGMQK